MSDPRFDPNRVKVMSPSSAGVGPVSATLDGLPKQFVAGLRTLFDILDDKASGYVKFSDIEKRWQDDGTKGLPKGVIESLRKVTPPNGLLSFERFCAGLKICLLRNQMEGRSRGVRVSGNNGGGGETSQPARPPSAPLLDLDGPPKPNGTQWGLRQPPPNSSMAQQRTLSMPQLPPATDPSLGIPVKPPLYGPPKPPRSAIGLDRGGGGGSSGNMVGSTGGHVDKAEIRSALQSWQLGMMKEEEKRLPGGSGGGGAVGAGYPAQPPPAAAVVAVSAQQATGQTRQRSMGDGKPPGQIPCGLVQDPNAQGQHKKQSGRRREPRRHTLQNGIDYNMLKRMKQIEVEKDVLMQGLEAVDTARDWYMKQIAAVQDKMKYLGRMGHSEQWTEAQDERLELQRARILEINRHLATLSEPGERGGLPLHMNLAVSPHSSQILARLKQQNHILTQEVSKKNDRITALEREKASLIRELFHSRTSQARPREQPQDNTAYI